MISAIFGTSDVDRYRGW